MTDRAAWMTGPPKLPSADRIAEAKQLAEQLCAPIRKKHRLSKVQAECLSAIGGWEHRGCDDSTFYKITQDFGKTTRDALRRRGLLEYQPVKLTVAAHAILAEFHAVNVTLERFLRGGEVPQHEVPQHALPESAP